MNFLLNAATLRWLTVRLVAFGLLSSLSGPLLIAQATNAKPSMDSSAEDWFIQKTEWNGYSQFHFRVADRSAYLVAPKTTAPGKPWIWRARFPNFHADADLKLLERGFHVAYVDVAGLYGGPQAVQVGDAFYQFLVGQRGLSPRPAMEGVSRGGLFVYNWALANPQCVSCIYCDTPVCDFKSWPAGQGSGKGSANSWKECLAAYGLDEASAKAFELNPVDRAKSIAAMQIPLLHIVSENDAIVPPSENTHLLKRRLEKLGCQMEVISVAEGTKPSNGHHFTHPKVDQVVDFMARHASVDIAQRQDWLGEAKSIVFLGDSITYAGDYVTFFETWLQARRFEKKLAYPSVINLGLPSETLSGLSESGHAGGRFPRPNLHDRLDRVLEQTKPDLVFACYGINCGIYQPFDDYRFLQFQKGLEQLKQKVHQAGANLLLITPPTFDTGGKNAKGQFNYDDEVMKKYTEWLTLQNDERTQVIDLHTAMQTELAIRRQSDPTFTFQPDRVHPNSDGHWLIAGQLVDWFGDDSFRRHKSWNSFVSDQDDASKVRSRKQLVGQRMRLLRDGYLSATGHERPGITQGLPLDELKLKVRALNQAINNSAGN